MQRMISSTRLLLKKQNQASSFVANHNLLIKKLVPKQEQRAAARRTYSTDSSTSNSNTTAHHPNANNAAANNQSNDDLNDKEKELNQLVAKKDLEIVELKDLYRRALADAENVRIRTQKELADKSAYAIQSFAKDLLSTADILEMALKSVPEKDLNDEKNKELKALWTGVSMTKKELIKVFAQYGITEFNPLGEKFDFHLHTALFQSSIPDKEPGTVFHVDKVGYKIKDRILRPANVGVVKDPNN